MASKLRELKVKVTPVGPDASFTDQLQTALMKNAAFRKVAGEPYRVVAVDFVDEDDKTERRPSGSPKRFRATVYDSANQRSLLVEGDVDRPHKATVTPSARQPRPTSQEFQEAVNVLSQDAELGTMIREDRLRPYRPMPPLIPSELPDGRIERTISVGLRPSGAGSNEIVGVNLNRRSIIRFDGGAPPNARATNQECGQPDAGQPTIRSTPGQVWVTVSQGGTVLV